MKKLIIASSVGLLCATATVQADTIFGLYAGAHAWQSAFSGDINSNGDADIDIENDLGFDNEANTVIYVAVEHPVPMLPNIKIQQTAIEISGINTLSASGLGFSFDDIPFDPGANIDSDVDFSHTDITLYYELLDNWVSLDLGLTARIFDGSIEINNTVTADNASINLDAKLPMIYTKAQFDLPLTGLGISVDGNFVGFGGNSLLDLNASINYEFAFGLGVAVGYRNFTLELDDVDDLDSELTIDGAYAGLTYHF